MKRIFFLLLAIFAVVSLSAEVSKAAADSAYHNKQYKEAAVLYAAMADSIESDEIYYNLGNAEFRLKRFPQAVLAYERALRVNPDNADARYNLALVRTRLTDRFSKPSEMFFVSWARDWLQSHSAEHWATLGFFWLIVVFAGLALYLLSGRMWIRKCGFFVALLSAVFFVFVTSFALHQRYRFYHNDKAVILADEVQLYSSPSLRSKALKKLHEGTTVIIREQSQQKWMLVELPDGTSAWMQSSEKHERVVPVK